jgi:D-alanyl-D-alanine carboxypeptidase
MKDSQSQKKKRLFKKTKTSPRAAAKQPLADNKSSSRWFSFLRNALFKKSTVTGTQGVNADDTKDESIIRKHEYAFQLLLIPLILLMILAILVTLNKKASENLQAKRLSSQTSLDVSRYPLVRENYTPFVSAKTAIAVDAQTQGIVFSKNPDVRFSMASTVKIMTALVALDHYKANAILTVKSGGIDGTTLNIKKGESFYFEDLLYAMLLPSANDAAVAIVDNYPGGKEAFVKKMNEKAKTFHLDNTQFSEATGLDDDGNFTTVVDLSRLATQAMQNRDFTKIVSTQQKIITNQSKSRQYVLVNLNRLLGTNGVNGIKTGTTEGAGEVLVTSSIQHGRMFIIVVMNSLDRFSDTNAILNYIAENVTFVSPSYVKN